MQTISTRVMRNENHKVLREVEAGETFVVTRNGVPVARLTPLAEPQSGDGMGRPSRPATRAHVLGAIPRHFSDLASESVLTELRADR